ncbi:MAG: hypothetical protein M3R17_18090 [Bacteroidota bacterium]|nr:hypothetical protein [Bacteroidota bacterium]
MKKSFLFLVLISSVLISATVITNNCDFEQFTNGATYTMTSYDAKAKVTSSSYSTVKNVVKTGTGVSADIETLMKDGKEKDLGSGTISVKCDGDKYSIDMKSFVSAQMNQANKDMTMTFEGNLLEYSAAMTVGQSLPDGNLTVHAANNGSEFSVTTINIHDRKVEAIESKTTPAGTWECYKISYIEDVKMKMGGMNIPGMKPVKVIEWFSFKVGTVRSETYRNEKMEGYNELTSFKKP